MPRAQSLHHDDQVEGRRSFSRHDWLSIRAQRRVTASAVLVHVVYVKLFVTGGWESMVGAILAGAAAAAVRRKLAP